MKPYKTITCLEIKRYNTINITHVIEIGLYLFKFDLSLFFKIGVIIDFSKIMGHYSIIKLN